MLTGVCREALNRVPAWMVIVWSEAPPGAEGVWASQPDRLMDGHQDRKSPKGKISSHGGLPVFQWRIWNMDWILTLAEYQNIIIFVVSCSFSTSGIIIL